MTKFDFLMELNEKLSGLPEEDVEKSLQYYSEMISDRMEDGLGEAEAVAAVGEPAEIAAQIEAQILSEMPLGQLVRTKLKPTRTWRAWEIVLLVLGAPGWVPLLVSVLSVVFSVYVSIWSAVVSLYAANLALAVSAVACVIAAVPYVAGGSIAASAFMFGCGLIVAGLAIFMFFGCGRIAGAVLRLGKLILRGIRACFIGKGAAK